MKKTQSGSPDKLFAQSIVLKSHICTREKVAVDEKVVRQMPMQPDLLCWPCTVNSNWMSPFFFVPLKEVKYQLNSTLFYDASIHARIEVEIKFGFKVISYLNKNMRRCHLPSLHSLTSDGEVCEHIYYTHGQLANCSVKTHHSHALFCAIQTWAFFYSSVSTLSNFTGLSSDFQTWR